GAARTCRPTCCRSRRRILPAARRPCRTVQSCRSATSSSPSRRSAARRRRRARCLPTTSPTLSCTAPFTSSASIISPRPKRSGWRGWSAASLPRSALPIPMRHPPGERRRRMADASAGPTRDPDAEGERPFRALRNWLRHLRRPRNGDSALSSLEAMIEEREEIDEPIDPQEQVLLGNILKLHDLKAADVMVQRVDIVALEVGTPFPEVVKQFVEQGHSRLPVYRETLDEVIGFVHIKDVLARLVDGQPTKLDKLVRKLLVVAPSMAVLDLLLQMRLSRVHMAMVVDEFGGIDGLVTIEDLIEEIVGEIEDEYDDAK